MEIPVINRMSDFHDPSFLSRLLSISQIYQPYSLWKWGAVILALLATFPSIINRTKFFFIRLRKHNPLAAEPLLVEPDDDGDIDSEDETCSSTSSDEDDIEPTSPVGDEQDVRIGYCEDEPPRSHKMTFRRRRSIGDNMSLSDFTNGKSVVKLWDGLSLENSGRSLLSIYDLNKDLNISSFFGGPCQFPVSRTSPAVVVSAAAENAKNIALRVWDTRVGLRIPAIFAEWKPQMGKSLSITSGGVEKIYVRDDVNGKLTVGDMRNVSSPLRNAKESNGETWWDADAVMVLNECIDQLAVNGCESIVSRCRDAVKSCLF